MPMMNGKPEWKPLTQLREEHDHCMKITSDHMLELLTTLLDVCSLYETPEDRSCLLGSKLVHTILICALKCGNSKQNQWKSAYDRLLQLFDPIDFVPNAKLKLKKKKYSKIS